MEHQQQEQQELRPSQRRRRPQHFLLDSPPLMRPQPQKQQQPTKRARQRRSELYNPPPRRTSAKQQRQPPPSLLVVEETSFDNAFPAPSLAATPPSVDGTGRRRPSGRRGEVPRPDSRCGRFGVGGPRRKVVHGEPHLQYDYDGDDDDNSDGSGRRDKSDDDVSISLRSELLFEEGEEDEEETSPGGSEWTLQTFVDDQRYDASRLMGGRRAGGARRRLLSLASAHSINTASDDKKTSSAISEAEGMDDPPICRGSSEGSEWTLQTFADHQRRASHIKGGRQAGARRSPISLSLAGAQSNGASCDKKTNGTAMAKAPRRGAYSLSSARRDRFPRKSRTLRKLLLICAALGVLVGTLFLSATSFKGLAEDGASTESPVDHEFGEVWHPLFQHGQRTADVEVEVPLKPSPKKKDRGSSTGGLAKSSDAGSVNGDGSGLGSAAARRRQQASRPDEPSFMQGEVVQELCPATHTLLSQSLILRSSYGNIFSITTPDSEVRKRKGGIPHKQRQHVSSTVESGESEDQTLARPDDGGLFWRKRSLQQQRDPTDGPTTTAQFWGYTPTNPSSNAAGATAAPATNAPTGAPSIGPSVGVPTTGAPTPYPTTGAPSPNPTDDNSNNQYQGNLNDIDTAAESIYTGSGVDTITIQTLSLRMSDFRPVEDTHFEVWLYTGSGNDVEVNENDLDDDPSNDNLVVPSKGEYQASRAKFTDWILIAEGMEKDLVPDLDFFDHNGHVFNIGAGTTMGPLGRLDGYENMEDVTLAAREWNEEKVREDGGMDAITAEGEVTTTYFYKIPEEKFMPLKLPKYNGKLTLFVTLDRVGLQYGYAAKPEFDKVDVTKHDYIDQTPSLDVLNGNVNLRMSVGEGVIFYPWMEEEFFYQTRRFLGKIWYEARIPCDYAPTTEVLDISDASVAPSEASSEVPTWEPSSAPSLAPSINGTNVTAELLVSVLIKKGPLPPMPSDVQEIFEDTLLEFVKDEFAEFCPITWDEGANVAGQELTPVGGLPTAGTREDLQHTFGREGGDDLHVMSKRREPDDRGGGVRYLRQLLEPIFSPPPQKARSRLLNAITLLDVTTVVDALYSAGACADKTPEELANLIENFINDNDEEFLDLLKSAHDYFKDAFGVSADVVGGPIVEVRAAAAGEEEAEVPLGAIIGGIMAALVLCCFCCCLPFLVARRRKRKQEQENKITGENIEWARPVSEDHFPPLGGYRDDVVAAGGDGEGYTEEDSKLRKRRDGELPRENETPPDIALTPIPPGIRPPSEDTEMLHSHRWTDREDPEKQEKERPFRMPGRMPGEEDEPDPSNININAGGGYEEGEHDPDGLNLRRVEKETPWAVEEDWKPEHYEPDGGVHSYDRPQKPSPEIDPDWNQLPRKEEPPAPSKKKLSIKQLVLQRKRDLEAKKAAMRVDAGQSDEEEENVFPKADPDSRIEYLMGRIKDLESTRVVKYQRPQRFEEESDYERWKRLNIQEKELTSSEESSNEEVELRATKQRKKKKEKGDYILNFEDLDAYNRALAVHQDAYIHKWVKVKVEKGEEDDDEGANLDDIEVENPNVGDGE